MIMRAKNAIAQKTGRLAAKAATLVLGARSRKGMELVQVGILIAIAVIVGLIFKTQITSFVNDTFTSLTNANFTS